MFGWVAAAATIVAVLVWLGYRPLRKIYREIEVERARELFSLQRERLEAKFIDLAGSSGKPRGFTWENCEFADAVRFARDRQTGQLGAFVEVSIRIAPRAGALAKHNASTEQPRHATAVFHYQHGQWGTGGRALLNMNPDEAISHFQTQYESLPSV